MLESDVQNKPLRFFNQDIERRFGITAGDGTSVNAIASGTIALLLTILFYVALYLLPANSFGMMLTDRGPTQHFCVFFGFWCVLILLVKWRKLKLQRRALQYSIIPDQHDFVLSSQTANLVVQKIYEIAADPERFIAYDRILLAIENIKNLGRVSDVDEILQSCAERDESANETSFSLIHGFLWAIPVLGFIGTVLGLSQSIATFSGILGSSTEVNEIVGSLKEITGGLSTAFETTLVALVLALAIQLWMTFQKKSEEEFLDDCKKYGLRQVVSRIRLLPYEQAREA